MPWLLITLAVALSVAIGVEPMVGVWAVLLLPAWLVLVPIALPPAERKLAKTVAVRRERRVAARRARDASPGDPRAGLSLADGDREGALTVVAAPADAGEDDPRGARSQR